MPFVNKINAIKALREASGLGLKEAKDEVEKLIAIRDLCKDDNAFLRVITDGGVVKSSFDLPGQLLRLRKAEAPDKGDIVEQAKKFADKLANEAPWSIHYKRVDGFHVTHYHTFMDGDDYGVGYNPDKDAAYATAVKFLNAVATGLVEKLADEAVAQNTDRTALTVAKKIKEVYGY